MSSSSPLSEHQLENRHESAQHATEGQPQKHHLEAALDRSATMPGQTQKYASVHGLLVQ